MCGIAGIIGKNADEAVVKKMTDAIAHRGPDGEGFFNAPGIALGHRRLKIIDLTDNARQPMTTADGRYTIIFNGEVYNYLELRREIEGQFSWRSTSDTEVILNSYALWGPRAVERWNGMFAVAIYDATEKTLFCVRDRLGIKPFYYHFDGGRLLFGSEIKALLVGGARREPNGARITDFLSHGLYDHTNETFFDGIEKLPAGHYFVVRSGGAPRPIRYWYLPEAAARATVLGTESHVLEAFEALLQDSIRLRLRSDVPVGVTLSSGIDSTSLLLRLRSVHPDLHDLHAFSACFADERFDEGRAIQRLVERFGTPWHQSILSPDEVFPLAEEVLHYQDEPYGGVPLISFLKLHRLARARGVTVLLEGHGVEEYLTGYPRYFPPFWSDLLFSGSLSRLWKELRGFSGLRRGSISEALIYWYAYAAHRHGGHLDLTRASFPQVVPKSYRIRHERPAVFDAPFQSRLQNELFCMMSYTKLPRVLRFQDRVSMASGRELRLPFLDYRLVEFVTALPARYKIRDGVDKWLLRSTLPAAIAAEGRTKAKRYVVTPQTAWFKNELRPQISAILTSDSFVRREWVDHGVLTNLLRKFYADPRPENSFFIWQFINLEQWYRRYFEV